MTLRLNGTTSGYTEIDSAAIGNNNLLTLPTTSAGTLIAANSSGVLQMNSGYGSNANAYGCRAWVNFNGTGTVAIRASGNVSSITDIGTGIYTVNLATAMANVNYAVTLATDDWGGSSSVTTARTTSTFRINTFNTATGNGRDDSGVQVAIFR